MFSCTATRFHPAIVIELKITFAIVSIPGGPLVLATEGFRWFIECARTSTQTGGQLTVMLQRKIYLTNQSLLDPR